MYQQNAKQKNKPNVIVVSFSLSGSSLKPRPKPAQTVCPETLEYAINSQDAKRGEQEKFGITRCHEQIISTEGLWLL